MSGIKHNKTRKNERAEHPHALKTSLTEASAHKTTEVCEMGIYRIKAQKMILKGRTTMLLDHLLNIHGHVQSREYVAIIFCTTLC